MAMSNFSDKYLNKSLLVITILLITVDNSISLTEILFETGSLINIPCDLRSSNIHWYKDREPVGHYPGIYVDDSGNLKIQDANPSHTGNYKCRDSAMDDDYSVHITIQDCGFIPEHEVIENGRDTTKTNHPWNAGIYQYENPDFIHFCGGTLITPIIVISAAHCVKQDGNVMNKDEIFIGLGKGYRNYNDSKDINSAQLKRVTELYISPHYDGETVTYYSDIVLFELKTPAKSTRYVQTACIDMANRFKLNDKAAGTLAGWGRRSINGEQHVVLQEGHFPYVNKDQCGKYLQEQKSPYNVAQDKFCSGKFPDYSEKTSLTRQGDSGSGMIFKFNKKNYLFGVASTVIENYDVCLFTDVRFVANLEFIQEIIKFIRKKRNVHRGYFILPKDEDILANKEIGPVLSFNTKYMPQPTNNVINSGAPGKAQADIVLQNTNFQVGENIVIPCYVTGNPSPQVTWFKYDEPLENSRKVRILRNNTLLIQDADTSDSGLYKCQAEYNFKSGVPGSYQSARSYSSSTVYIYVSSSSVFKASDFMNRQNNFNKMFSRESEKDLSSFMNSQMDNHMNQPMPSFMNSQMDNHMNQPMPSFMKNQMHNHMNQPMHSFMNQPMPSFMNSQMHNHMNQQMPSFIKSRIPIPSHMNGGMTHYMNEMPSYTNSFRSTYRTGSMSSSMMDDEIPSNIKSMIHSNLNNQQISGFMNSHGSSLTGSEMHSFMSHDTMSFMDDK